jgi:tetraacyldisaccharide 4'-kinase
MRNLLYSRDILKSHHSDAIVISVGNITAGGTGKTPLVIWLCTMLQKMGLPCAILTRGYKLKKNKLSDEPAILTTSCPEAHVIVNPDRVIGAGEAVGLFGAKVLVMDDGFQHRRLKRDLDIVTIDAMCPFGYDKTLPAGYLREPVTALTRAQCAVITRCDLVSESQLNEIEDRLKTINPEITIARTIHAPVCAKTLGSKEIPLEELAGKKIFGFCGIGNPDAFLRTVKNLGANLVGHSMYNDHHHYTSQCMKDICEEARYLGVDMILTTQKDWTKTALPVPTKDILLAYLVVELDFVAGEEELTRLIKNALTGKMQ